MRPTRIRDCKMKNLDLISKRILIISLSISAVLLSASLFIFAAKPANAQSPPSSNPLSMENGRTQIDDGRKYDAFVSNGLIVIWNTQTGTYRFPAGNGSIDNLTEKFW